MDALASALQAPFYALAWLLAVLGIAPDPAPIVAVGQRRAPEFAKATYPIYEYLAAKYIGAHPDQVVNASLHIVVLDGIGLAPDLAEAIQESRRRAAVAAHNGAIPQTGNAVV